MQLLLLLLFFLPDALVPLEQSQTLLLAVEIGIPRDGAMVHHLVDSSVERDLTVHGLVCRNHILLALFELFQQVGHAFTSHETTVFFPISEGRR